jgi:hypothetical protein
MVAALLFQIIAGSFHLFFKGEVFNNVYYLDSQLFHIGLLPSVFLWVLVKGKAAKMLGLTLVVYNFFCFIMEVLAVFGYSELVTEVNSYYFSELIFIILALLLTIIGLHLTHGISWSRTCKPFGFLAILRPDTSKRAKN